MIATDDIESNFRESLEGYYMTTSQIETYRHRIYPHYKTICADGRGQAINAKRELRLFCTQWPLKANLTK